MIKAEVKVEKIDKIIKDFEKGKLVFNVSNRGQAGLSKSLIRDIKNNLNPAALSSLLISDTGKLGDGHHRVSALLELKGSDPRAYSKIKDCPIAVTTICEKDFLKGYEHINRQKAHGMKEYLTNPDFKVCQELFSLYNQVGKGLTLTYKDLRVLALVAFNLHRLKGKPFKIRDAFFRCGFNQKVKSDDYVAFKINMTERNNVKKALRTATKTIKQAEKKIAALDLNKKNKQLVDLRSPSIKLFLIGMYLHRADVSSRYQSVALKLSNTNALTLIKELNGRTDKTNADNICKALSNIFSVNLEWGS